MSQGKSIAKTGRYMIFAIVVGLMVSAVAVLPAQAQDGVNQGRITLSAGVDFATQYWFRGLAQENQGVIAQPWIDIGVNLYEGEGSSLDLNFGIWNSWHDGPSGSGSATTDPRMWYEADWYAGLSATLAENWCVGVVYTAYTSPNDTFTTTEEFALSVGYDDAGCWESMGMGFGGLQPSVTVAIETDGGADAGMSLGTYFEVALAPSFTLVDSEDYPITLSIPLTAGWGDDYYETATEDDGFGYFDAGAELSMPLAFIPGEYGAWSLSAGVHVIFLGDTAQDIAGPAVTGGDDTEVYGTLGISFEY